ncbi:MAG: ATP-binding protein [Candidatus Magnetoovum sp. WYHC-5]|nr:ATP-binding protein [Candidatus Magnetoovum sp. WYHC-5]
MKILEAKKNIKGNVSIMIKNLSIKSKITLLVTLVVSLMLIPSIIAIYYAYEIGAELDDMSTLTIPLSRVITEITENQLEQTIQFATAKHHIETKNREGVSSAITAFEKVHIQIKESISRGEGILARPLRQSIQGSDLQNFLEIGIHIETIEKKQDDYYAAVMKLFDMAKTYNSNEIHDFTGDLIEKEADFDKEIKAFLSKVEQFTEKSTIEVRANEQFALRLTIIIFIVCLISSIVIGMLLAYNITSKLALATSVAETISRGGMPGDIDTEGKDEAATLLKSISHMAETIRLSSEAIERKTVALERSNTELQQFAYIASHDLQEPLRVIGNFTELMSDRYRGQLDADADEFMGFIMGAVELMQQLIDDLLTYSRIDTKGIPFEVVDLPAIIESVKDNLRMAMKDSGGAVSCASSLTFKADRMQMLQLFQNLIGNAIKFRAGLPPLIDVQWENKPTEWLFKITDNGIGIASEHHKDIFMSFIRLHTRQEYEGTGIGLAICKKIVQRHGGDIWVESQLGRGSTFFFTIKKNL